MSNQYRIGIYPFINQLATLAALTGDINSLKTMAQCSNSWPLAFTNLLDTGRRSSIPGDPTTAPARAARISRLPSADETHRRPEWLRGRSTAKPQAFVFLVTDGMQNGQHFFTSSNGNYAYPGNPSNFRAMATPGGTARSRADRLQELRRLEAAGATISILYIPYNQISFVNNLRNVAWANGQVNGFSPTLASRSRLRLAGLFPHRQRRTTSRRRSNAMFEQALKVARLIK